MSVVVVQMNVVERCLSLVPAQIRIKLMDRLAVGDGIVNVNMTFRVRLRTRPGSLDGKVRPPRDGVVVTGERLHFRDVGMLEIEVRSKGIARIKLPIRERSTHVEERGGFAVHGASVTDRDGVGRKLNISSQRVPMHFLFGSSVGSGDDGVEILNLQMSGKAGRRNFAARHAREMRAAMQRDRKSIGPVKGNNEWQHAFQDRKSTRLNSSHVSISYAVFCLKKKKKKIKKRKQIKSR